jgi:hypothetical protein
MGEEVLVLHVGGEGQKHEAHVELASSHLGRPEGTGRWNVQGNRSKSRIGKGCKGTFRDRGRFRSRDQ